MIKDNNKINKINTLELNKTNRRSRAHEKTQETEPLVRTPKPHKRTKLKAVIYLQRTEYRHTHVSSVSMLIFFLVSAFPSSTCFPPPLLQGSLIPEGRDLMETSHLRQSVPRSLTLCTLSSVGLYICSHLLQEEASLRMAKQGTDL